MKVFRAFTGWLPVATKEARATVLSPRFLVISAILTLAVVAGTYTILPGAGVSAANEVAYGFTYYPDLNRSQPEMAMFVTSPSGNPLAGIGVQLARQEDREKVILETRQTDGGWARFDALATRYPNRNLVLLLADDPRSVRAFASTSPFADVPAEYRGLLQAQLVPLGLSDRRVVSLVFLDSRGAAIVGADVYVWKPEGPVSPPFDALVPPGGWEPYRNGTTGAEGFFIRNEPLSFGQYLVHARRGQLNDTALVSFPAEADPLNRGPDGVLAFVGASFLPFLLPIVALVLGYDAISRERSEGSLDLLLAKPVGRLGVAIGKMLGAFGSSALPVVIVLSASALLIWFQSGSAPTPGFLGTFLGIALFILLTYTVIFLALSTLMKNSGTALLVSVLLFLLFTFFWGLVSLLVANAVAVSGSPSWYDARVALSLFSPTGVYQQWLTLSAPALTGGFYGPIGGTAARLPAVWTALAAVVWTVGPLVLFLWAVKYRLGEN